MYKRYLNLTYRPLNTAYTFTYDLIFKNQMQDYYSRSIFYSSQYLNKFEQ